VMYRTMENDQLIHLSTVLNQGDLVQIASGMMPYLEMNAANISYIAGLSEIIPSTTTDMTGINLLLPALISDYYADNSKGFVALR
jgi:UPF0716 family protein affecting phage T7 exclusion